MAEEEWMVATQQTLGTLISKPKMTEKYLKKPPFRFLHDIIMEVTRATGFAAGLFSAEESDAANLADKSAKVDFLNRAISVVCFALNDKIDVSANKIVAGLEADKTNMWLQKLHQAATTAVDQSASAVQRVQAGETVAGAKKKKPKEEAEGGAPEVSAADGAADPAAAAEEEARKAEEKRRRREKREEEKRKAAEEEAARQAAPAGAAPPAPEAAPPAPAADAEAEEADRKAKKEEERRKKEEKRQREERKRQQAEEEEARRQQEQAMQQQALQEQQVQEQAMLQQQQQQQLLAQQQAGEEEQRRQQMMMEQQMQQQQAYAGYAEPGAPGSAQQPYQDPSMQGSPEEIAARADAMMQGGDPMDGEQGRPERPRTAGRKPPKVSSRTKTSHDEPGLAQAVAPPTIIQEGAKDEDEDDMFEAPAPAAGLNSMPVAADANEPHGKLVRDLLAEKKAEEDKERLRQEEEATREEVEDPSTQGIKMGKLKRKKDQAGTYAEIDTVKLSESIQQLCQAANPLGKSIDLVHQDIANMGKELDHWKQEYREASEQYQSELKMTDELLLPLYQKIADLDDKIAEQNAKIRNSRSRISKNDLKIHTLLESVVMAK